MNNEDCIGYDVGCGCHNCRDIDSLITVEIKSEQEA